MLKKSGTCFTSGGESSGDFTWMLSSWRKRPGIPWAGFKWQADHNATAKNIANVPRIARGCHIQPRGWICNRKYHAGRWWDHVSYQGQDRDEWPLPQPISARNMLTCRVHSHEHQNAKAPVMRKLTANLTHVIFMLIYKYVFVHIFYIRHVSFIALVNEKTGTRGLLSW